MNAVENIFPHAPGFEQIGEVAVGRGDNPDIRLAGFNAADGCKPAPLPTPGAVSPGSRR